MAGPSLASEIVVTDGDTLKLDGTIYRLDGIDAPEIDQTCLDQSGDVWPCAIAHAKSGDAAMISGYCGTGDVLPDAIGKFSLTYLEQTRA